MLNAMLESLVTGQGLTEAQAETLAGALTSDDVPPALAGALLAGLRAKGETEAEVRGFARALQARAIPVEVPREGPPLVDTAGTGGDGSNSLNLSTAAALLAAAAGCRVVKHGNRALSSKCGSADVLEASGIALSTRPDDAARQLATAGFTFLFAPAFHPTLKVVGAIRKAMGVRTIFNLLGPLLNPARPDAQVIGVATDAVGHLIAHAASGLAVPRVFVVHGAEGWDEPTPVGPFKLWSVTKGQVQVTTRDPLDLGIVRCTAADLRGSDPARNAQRLQAVLTGREQGAHRDAVLLGAALTLEVAGLASEPSVALSACRAAIDDGRAAALLDRLKTPADVGNAHPEKAASPAHERAAAAGDGAMAAKMSPPVSQRARSTIEQAPPTKIGSTKGKPVRSTIEQAPRTKVAPPLGALAKFVADSMDRAQALPPLGTIVRQASDQPPAPPLRVDGFGVIAEVKFKAPSVAGALGAPSAEEAVRRARAYAEGGAAAISVLTAPVGFDGELAHLRAVARQVAVPAMRKDFLVDPRQVFEARAAGAAGVLLIARILDDLAAMLEAAREAGLFTLVELFDESDLDALAALPADDRSVLVGVNCRDLDTLAVVPDRHRNMQARLSSAADAPGASTRPLTVAESGLDTAEDAARVAKYGYDLVLVGSALMRGGDPAGAVRAMTAAGRTARSEQSADQHQRAETTAADKNPHGPVARSDQSADQHRRAEAAAADTDPSAGRSN